MFGDVAYGLHSLSNLNHVPKLDVLYHVKPYFGNIFPLHSPKT